MIRKLTEFVGVVALVVGMAVGAVSVGRLSGGPAQASSTNMSSDGNCNNGYPHGWGWTDYYGYGSTDYTGVTSNLQQKINGSWFTQMDGADHMVGAPNGEPEVDNYYDNYEAGTGMWQEYSWHSGSMISGNPTSSHAITC